MHSSEIRNKARTTVRYSERLNEYISINFQLQSVIRVALKQ